MNTIKCPNCSNKNSSKNIKCENCGTQLITEDQSQDKDLESNTQFNLVDNDKIDAFIEIFIGITTTIGGIIFSGLSSMIVFKGVDNFTKIIGIPFLICGLSVLIFGISLIVKRINKNKNANDYVNGILNREKIEKSEKNFDKVEYFVNHLFIYGFLLFWFGFLIVYDIGAIESWSDGGCSLFFFSFIFWAVGIYILITNIKN